MCELPAWTRSSVSRDPSYLRLRCTRRGCPWLRGDAQDIVGRLRAITPVVMPDANCLRNLEHRELYLSGLRLAAGGGAIISQTSRLATILAVDVAGYSRLRGDEKGTTGSINEV